MKTKTKSGLKRFRRGAATVEFAVTIPIIMIIVIGSMEATSMIFLRQTMVQAAYEGVKVGTKPKGTNAIATNAINNVVDGRNLTGVTVTFDPADLSNVEAGELVTVTVSAPGDANSFLPFGPFQNRMVEGQAVMVKE